MNLTTVHVYRRKLGVTAIRTLLSLIDSSTPCAVKTTVAVKIVERGSVKKQVKRKRPSGGGEETP